MRQIFLGEGLETLTDALIDELVSAGWAKERLIEARDQGMSYSRPRNSFITPLMSSEDEEEEEKET